MKTAILLLSILFCLISCSPRDKIEIEKSASAFDLNQAKAAVKQTNLSFIKSFKKKDTSEIVQSFTKDAKLLPNGRAAIEGKDSIREFYKALLNSNVKQIELNTESIWGDSILVAEEGTYTFEGKDSTVDKGKYIVLWKRESGNWKMYRDMWTSDFKNNGIVYNADSKKEEDKKSKKKK